MNQPGISDFVNLYRSRANPSIIAVHVPGLAAVKIKTADKPYSGESGVGSQFTISNRFWAPVDPKKDTEALDYLMAWYRGGSKRFWDSRY